MLGFLLGAAALLGAFGEDDVTVEDDNYNDEDMYACTDAWRALHPYGYNPHTGGWNAEEDEENGW